MDRFVRGFILGFATSAVKDIINLLNYHVFHSTNVRFADFMGNMVFRHKANSMIELVVCQILELGYEGVLGVIFIYFAYHTYNKKNLWFKGIVFSEGIYVLNYALASFFKLPIIQLVDLKTVLSQSLSSAVFGAILGLGVYWWGKKLGDFEDTKQTV
jgi:hypothetical protein